jgi:hypothetical protein
MVYGSGIMKQINPEGSLDHRCRKCGRGVPEVSFYPTHRPGCGLRSCCSSCGKAANQAYNRTEAAKRSSRDGRLRTRFGVSVEDYEAMLLLQGALCAICRRPEPDGRRLSVDHCHKTGKVRGLLCFSCNTGLGKLGDDVGRLLACVRYLERHSKAPV